MNQAEQQAFDAMREALEQITPELRGLGIVSDIALSYAGIASSALAAAKAVSEGAQTEHPWQPIETAPKDGRKIIVTYTNRYSINRTVMARWLTDDDAADKDTDGVGLQAGWYECIDNWDEYTEVAIHEGNPTHWMPLPPPPCNAPHKHVPETNFGNIVQPQAQGAVAAIETLVGMGYTYHGGEQWKPPLGKPPRFLDEAQPQARKPLTDFEMWQLWNSQGDDAMEQQAAIKFARAIEAAHGIKE